MKIIIDKDYFEVISKEFPEIEFYTEVNECPDADAIIGLPDLLKRENLEKLPNLKWMQLFRAGFDMLDMEYIRNRGLILCNGKDIFSVPIAEDVLCKILVHSTNTLKFLKQQKTHTWDNTLPRLELCGQTIGIIGTGSIATEIAKRLQPFDVKVLGFKKTPVLNMPYFDEIYSGKKGLEYVMSNSDYLIITAQLNDSTYHLINKDNIKLMKKTASIINIARGGIINQADLKEALKNGTIEYSALDVFEKEPLPADDDLWDYENVYITPHTCGLVKNNKQRWENLIIKNIKNFMENETMINVVR